MPLPFPLSIDEQKAAIDSAGEFTLTHTDTCLSCYVLDHMNGDNEMLLSASVDGDSTYADVKSELLLNLNESSEEKPGFDYDKATAAIAYWFEGVEPTKLFDVSLESAPKEADYGSDDLFEDAQNAYDEASEASESCYAWFRLAWPAQEDAT
jgi:hypothetical protein